MVAAQTTRKEEKENETTAKIDQLGGVPDATGGMWSKIEIASRCTAQGIDVTICKGGTKDAKLALLGRYTPNATVFIAEQI